MKIIIAGSRSIISYEKVQDSIKTGLIEFGITQQDITEIVSGNQKGAYIKGCWRPTVDLLGQKWATDNNIDIVRFDANWDKYGQKAGPMRNRQMAAYADALIVVWDGESRGTYNMIEEMRKLGKPIHIRTFKDA